MSGQLKPWGRKLFLYSGHEVTIAWLLTVMNVFEPHIPPYGAHVVVELRKIRGLYGFKVFHLLQQPTVYTS